MLFFFKNYINLSEIGKKSGVCKRVQTVDRKDDYLNYVGVRERKFQGWCEGNFWGKF